MPCVRGPEQLIATQALTRITLKAILAATMRVKCGCAVRTDNPQVLESVIVGDSVYVIQDERHPTTPPALVLPTQLAPSLLDTLLKKSALEMSS